MFLPQLQSIYHVPFELSVLTLHPRNADDIFFVRRLCACHKINVFYSSFHFHFLLLYCFISCFFKHGFGSLPSLSLFLHLTYTSLACFMSFVSLLLISIHYKCYLSTCFSCPSMFFERFFLSIFLF